MKCHYEVLGLEQDCDDAKIKSSYRKLALRWHPDKNLQNLDEAKEQFLLVQQAYEVLSDPQERAFYDKHRDQILRGKNSQYEDNYLDLFQYFTVSCFKGYTDEKGGFYDVFSKVFETIATEDAEFIDDEDDIQKIPKFGNSKSSYEDCVGPFYAFWSSYSTRKTYSWLCQYDITEIKDRRILREIEKETKKLAQKARKERNDEVRNLVSFIRKRDKRVQANKKLLEEKAEANRQKQQQVRLEQIKKRQNEIAEAQKSHANSSMNADFEEQLRQLEKEYGDSDSEYSDDEDYDDLLEDLIEEDEEALEDDIEADFDNLNLDDLYCPACEKEFNHKNAFKNHISSKKHKDNVEKLKKEMTEMEDAYQESQQNGKVTDDEDLLAEEEEEEKEDEKLVEQTSKKSKKKKSKPILVYSEDDIPELSDDDEILAEDELFTSKKSKKKRKGKGNLEPNPVKEEEDEVHNLVSKSTDDSDWEDKKKNKKNNKKAKPVKSVVKEVESDKDDESDLEDLRKGKKNGKSKKKAVVDEESDVNHVCVTCKAEFESKNKLFTHLKKMNHGVYIPKKGAVASEVPSGKKKGKK